MVDITFLGTGGAFAAGRRSNLALLIEAPDFRMLVESGPMIVYQLARADLRATDIDRVFVSHGHGDHVLGFPMLSLNRLHASTPLQVYAGLSTIATLQILGALTFSSLRPGWLNLEWHELSEEGPDGTGVAPGVHLRTTVPAHPPEAPTLAARWDFVDGPSVTFVTDTRPGNATIELARGSDLLIHEASFSTVLQPDEDAAKHYHSTARGAGEVARQAGCPRLALVHLGSEAGGRPDVLVQEARAGTNLEVIVPEDGERLSIAGNNT